MTAQLQRRGGFLFALALAAVWAAEFAWLAVQRHLAGGSHAEDLGFTDQVLANFLRGQFFRMSIYQGATWNTELDISRLARPDSLLAFHFEPMLLVLVPLYALGGGATLLLVIQAIAVAAGALPAYRLGSYAAGSTSGGLAVALAYLLSPLGQWAVLADFHTATLAAPLLVLAAERLIVQKSPSQALAAATLAATTREDVGLAIAALGLALLAPALLAPPLRTPALLARQLLASPLPIRRRHLRLPASQPAPLSHAPQQLAPQQLAPPLLLRRRRRHWPQLASQPAPLSPSPVAAARPPSHELSVTTDRHVDRHAEAEKRHAGVMATSQNRPLVGWAFLGLGLASTILAALVIRTYSGGVLPFDVRYGATVGAGLPGVLAALGRPAVFGYLGVLALSGGWLGLLAPPALWPALPSVALNILSASPWMAAGKAHYSSLVLPFIAVAATAGLQRLSSRGRSGRVHLASGILVATGVVGYLLEGAGPLGGAYAPAVVTAHAVHAETLAQSLPMPAAISASSALVPRVSQRPRVYVFPAVLDADYVFLDLQASPAPTSAGDVFMRVRTLLADGGWNVDAADDGLLLLHRAPDAPPMDITNLAAIDDAAGTPVPLQTVASENQRVTLLSATLLPSPDGAIDVDGPRGILRTVWRAEEPLPSGTQLDFWLDLRDGQRLHVWDIASLWWNPPARWTPGQPVTIDVPDVPMRAFSSWQAVWTADD